MTAHRVSTLFLNPRLRIVEPPPLPPAHHGLTAAPVEGEWQPHVPPTLRRVDVGLEDVGHVDEAVPRKIINRVLNEKLHKTQYFGFTDRERDQIGHLLKYDDKAIASICDGVLAASCAARIIEKNVCTLDAEHLKCKMFRGGRKASGNMPTR